MKKLNLLLAALFTLIQFATFAGNGGEREWQLISEKDGIEFYISTDNVEGSNTKTFVKVRNTNGYKVQISFSAIFPCAQNQKKTQHETLFVASSGIAIYTYQVCVIENSDGFKLEDISILQQ